VQGQGRRSGKGRCGAKRVGAELGVVKIAVFKGRAQGGGGVGRDSRG
jgi:hypothetical protein